MLSITKRLASKSARYFIAQQKMLGNVNGYIEEMINGQKVVKVFCHEEEAKTEFDRRNEELFNASNNFCPFQESSPSFSI